MNKYLVYSCPDHIHWVKDVVGMVVVDSQNRHAHILRGDESVIWDWLMLGYDHAKMTRLLTTLLELSLAQAEQKLHDCLTNWNRLGLLEVQWGEQHG